MERQDGINYPENPFGGIPRALPFWSTKGGEDGNVISGAGGVMTNAVDMASLPIGVHTEFRRNNLRQATWLGTLLLEGH